MNLVKRFINSKWAVPAWLLLLTILAYGLLIPNLGFYFDDWPVIHMIQSGADFWDFYQYDRPLSAWTYVITAPVLGTHPLFWHVFTLLLRWSTSILLWWVLRLIWPNRDKETAWVALLFAVHPVFQQQSTAVAYSQHFITYALFFLSCGTMLSAVKKPGRAWLRRGVSILTAILHILTMEYFWGLELVRPLLLWIAYTDRGIPKKGKFQKTSLNGLPYMAILVAAVVWRVGFYSQHFVAGEDPNSLRLITALRSGPFEASLNFIEMAARDFVYVMVTVWTRTIQPNLIELDSNVLGFSWILVGLSWFFLWTYQKWIKPPTENDQARSDPAWNKQAIALGAAIFILGTLPVWITDKYISTGMFSDRFALPGMWGASILLVGLLSVIGVSHKPMSAIFSIMIALSIGAHFRVSNDYRWDWTNQQRFFWQLHWRAPELEPGTTIFSDGSIFSYAGEYPTAFAINTFYAPGNPSTELPYWFIELDSGFHHDPASYLSGIDLSESLRNYSFSGNSLDSIVLYYNPDEGNCLWVLDERDRVNNNIPGLTWDALPLSDLSRISGELTPNKLPSKAIFGKEPEHSWCFYYQKAAAARQGEDWEAVLRIKDTVDELRFEPNNKLEWIPFIDANVRLGHWEEAGELTLSAYERAPITRKTFCALWDSFNGSSMEAAIDQDTIRGVIVSLGCQ